MAAVFVVQQGAPVALGDTSCPMLLPKACFSIVDADRGESLRCCRRKRSWCFFPPWSLLLSLALLLCRSRHRLGGRHGHGRFLIEATERGVRFVNRSRPVLYLSGRGFQQVSAGRPAGVGLGGRCTNGQRLLLSQTRQIFILGSLEVPAAYIQSGQ